MLTAKEARKQTTVWIETINQNKQAEAQQLVVECVKKILPIIEVAIYDTVRKGEFSVNIMYPDEIINKCSYDVRSLFLGQLKQAMDCFGDESSRYGVERVTSPVSLIDMFCVSW